jgi:hypothetical protein
MKQSDIEELKAWVTTHSGETPDNKWVRETVQTLRGVTMGCYLQYKKYSFHVTVMSNGSFIYSGGLVVTSEAKTHSYSEDEKNNLIKFKEAVKKYHDKYSFYDYDADIRK